MTYNISTTIKRVYFKEIQAGIKRTEYKEMKPFWDVRVNKALDAMVHGERVTITFLCGHEVLKFRVRRITRGETPTRARGIIKDPLCYAIQFEEVV